MEVSDGNITTKWLDLDYAEVAFRDATMRFATTGSSSKKRVRTLFSKEPVTLAWIDTFEKGATLFDIGANVGMYTIYAAVMRDVKVHAFEPEALNYGELNKNIFLNDLHGQVLAYCLALSDVDKIDRLLLSDFGLGISYHDFEENSWTEDKEFAADWKVGKDNRREQGCIGRRVDSLVADGLPTPDHIKIDVDGLEHRVIEGMLDTLRNPALKSVLIEINFDNPKNLELIDMICALGWRFSWQQLRINRNVKFTVDQIKRYQAQGVGGLNYIFYKDEFYDRFFEELFERYTPGEPLDALGVISAMKAAPARAHRTSPAQAAPGVEALAAMQWPEVVELQNVVVSPLLPGSSKGYMAFYADPPSPLLRHYRYGRPESVIEVLPLSETDIVATQIIEEPVIYGGLMFRHFGHAISEGIHRIWPRYALKELANANVAFHVVNNSKIMPYVSAALNLHGISRNQVIPIQQPTLFRRLFVGQQARQMAGPTIIPGYAAMLDRDHARRLPVPERHRRIYVSRLHHHHTGSFYGESFVQDQLAAAGFEIVYPEQLTVTDLVTTLRDSSVAVFAEGSAIHALELCGSMTPAVFVIGRRPQALGRFELLLDNICSKWRVAEHWLASGGMSQDPKKHSSFIDLSALMADIWSFVGEDAKGAFDQELALEGIRRDLATHIADERNERTDDYEARARDLELRLDAIAKSNGNS